MSKLYITSLSFSLSFSLPFCPLPKSIQRDHLDPASAAWMMQHVSDHFSYSQDMTWLRAQGYILLGGVAAFRLSHPQQDAYTHDDVLVVNPCNSPEHGPTTFACTHYQQLLHQLFATIISRPTSFRLCRLPHQRLDHPSSARQRLAHLILGWCARMEAPS